MQSRLRVRAVVVVLSVHFVLWGTSSSAFAPPLIRSPSCLRTLLRKTNDYDYYYDDDTFWQPIRTICRKGRTHLFQSSFYGDFENFDDDDDDDNEEDDDDEEDDDEEEDDDLNDVDVANFRTRMSTMFGTQDNSSGSSSSSDETSAVDELISFATASSSSTTSPPPEWATSVEQIAPGTVLLANPAKFCSEFVGSATAAAAAAKNNNKVNPSLLAKFGLTLPPPADLGPDRRADLLPVLIVVEYEPKRTCRAVLLNRRTGYLLGDLEQPSSSTPESTASSSSSSTAAASSPQPLLEKFCIQPLWFGGVDNVSTGLEMLHLCPAVVGATQLTKDGLYWGGDPAQAQDAMSDPSLDRVMTGFDFKFFVQCTSFAPGQLEKEIQNGTFFMANVSKEVLFKSRDRMGTRRAKPLWTEAMELLDGEYLSVKKQLYDEEGSP